jgi:hypothetical protein
MMEMLKWGAEVTPNELVPRAASRRRRDQLVARLETLHTSIPIAGEPMAKAPFNHSQSAPAIEPPIDRRCARAAEHLLGGSHQLPGLGLQGRVREGVSTFVAQSLVQIVAFRPLGVGALTSLNKGFGDLEIRWSGFRREKPTPVVHERWAAFRSPVRPVKPIERPFMARSGHTSNAECPTAGIPTCH